MCTDVNNLDGAYTFSVLLSDLYPTVQSVGENLQTQTEIHLVTMFNTDLWIEPWELFTIMSYPPVITYKIFPYC